MKDSSTDNLPLSDDAVRLAGRLAASLTADQRVVLFTGLTAAEGVSTVAAQVAVAFAKMSQEGILLLEANIEDPTLHLRYDIPPAPGLMEVLERRIAFDAALSRKEMDNLWLLPVGRRDANYIELLGSDSCKKMFQLVRRNFRLIVIDGAALLSSGAMSLLASQADGVVAVIAAGRDHRAEVVELKLMLDGLKVRLVGAVLTSTDASRPSIPKAAR